LTIFYSLYYCIWKGVTPDDYGNTKQFCRDIACEGR